ncbi:uncharacterized protein BP01DRAFT_359035 [Aspergillus saccharolyticus JOP 1030-1]|uniref:Uncharacterized protein n=1 Tax=Aspergillus saccharolyticus JOP 1030-1 TaxID=1450539 RepID=A0A318Z8T9_9EURO|nr:hypothetical protein BP01DRAFT_359035 [Aspergillus saccharolyticus JOP 1030-1]PYH42804.1 hypothetical protein BP01DRAFT_359035 [Aspergillus saccharolyticus JOP 1030-1]
MAMMWVVVIIMLLLLMILPSASQFRPVQTRKEGGFAALSISAGRDREKGFNVIA